MLLAAEVLFEFGQFMRIVLWIFLPVFVVSFFLTSLYHYRRRKKKLAFSSDPDDTVLSAAESSGDYILFDHTGLVRQYKNKLSYNQAKYAALKHDFEQLELKYSFEKNNSSLHQKNINMENSSEEMMETITKMRSAFEAERNELHARLEQLDRSYKSLESENESLLEQISLNTAPESEKELFVNKWREENQVLKDKIAEQSWLNDLMGEKKNQIEYLQNQLEIRIKNFHQSERSRETVILELQKEKNQQEETNKRFEMLMQELAEKQELAAGYEATICHKQDQLVYIESQFREIKEQNELLNAGLQDYETKFSQLNIELEELRNEKDVIHQKFQRNKELMSRLYNEFSTAIEDVEAVTSPVITMQPVRQLQAAED